MPVATEEQLPGAGVLDNDELEFIFRLELERTEPSRGGGDDGGVPDEGEGRPGPEQGWPVLPAVVVTAAVAALLTLLSMIVQIWANLARAQLPGA